MGLSNKIVKISKNGHSPASLNNLCQCVTTLMRKKYSDFLLCDVNFLYCIMWSLLFYVFDVNHQIKCFLCPTVSQVKTDIRSPFNLLLSLKKFYLYIRCSDPLNILMAFHWFVLVCQCLTRSDNPKILYDALNLVSKCQRRRNKHSFWPTDYTLEVSLLAFTGARVHCWSTHNSCLLGLLCPLCKTAFLPVSPKHALLHGVTLPLAKQCIHFCWAVWAHLNVTRETAEDAVYPTVQVANDDFK